MSIIVQHVGRYGSADARSDMVDHTGFYERDSWSKTGNTQIGVFNAGEGTGSKGIPENISLNASAPARSRQQDCARRRRSSSHPISAR
jgi:hypothetical protein